MNEKNIVSQDFSSNALHETTLAAAAAAKIAKVWSCPDFFKSHMTAR